MDYRKILNEDINERWEKAKSNFTNNKYTFSLATEQELTVEAVLTGTYKSYGYRLSNGSDEVFLGEEITRDNLVSAIGYLITKDFNKAGNDKKVAKDIASNLFVLADWADTFTERILLWANENIEELEKERDLWENDN